jgi:C4-dicarboxylate-specific signal transduction histidine kinase
VTELSEYFRQHPGYVRELIRATRVIDVNEQTVATFGDGSRDGLLRGLDPLWPDESLHVFAESVAAAFRKQDHYSAEVVLHSLNGRRLDTLLTVSYPPELRHSARLLAGVIDVTDSKRARAAQERSERRYKDVFHFLPVALLQLDVTETIELLKELRASGITDLSAHLKQHPDLLPRLLEGLKVVEVNRRTLEMFRARSPEEFVGYSVARYWTEHPEPVRDALAARYSGKSGFEALVKIRAHDGTMLDALFFAAFGPVTGEQHVSLCGFIDVTDRVRAQEMLSKLQAEMAHAARVSVLGELTASIAHEVGQPLTAIEANTQATLLWAEQIPPNIKEIRELSASTAAQVQRAAAIIHRIRSMAVRIDPEYTAIDVNPMIEDSVLFLRGELQRNRIETSLRLIDALPRISGDRVQLQQVIVNLAVNAIQSMATISTTPRVLGITSRETSDGSVLIEVEDNGTGFSDETLGRLFESFFTTKSSGMGIGLPICRSIIDAHGGRILAANRTDGTQGACFTITLPGLHPEDLSRPSYRGAQPQV